MTAGRLIVLEGIDGSGKSTQMNLLAQRLQTEGRTVYLTREPSDGPIGTLIRQCLSGRIQFDEKTMAALFAADRLDHIHNKINGIKEKIAAGIDVLSDRYYLSNFAYQSVGVDYDWVKQLNAAAMQDMKPTAHIFIDVPVEVALERIYQNRGDIERYENKERLTHTREMFLRVIASLPEETIFCIDGSGSAEEIAQRIWNVVK